MSNGENAAGFLRVLDPFRVRSRHATWLVRLSASQPLFALPWAIEPQSASEIQNNLNGNSGVFQTSNDNFAGRHAMVGQFGSDLGGQKMLERASSCRGMAEPSNRELRLARQEPLFRNVIPLAS